EVRRRRQTRDRKEPDGPGGRVGDSSRRRTRAAGARGDAAADRRQRHDDDAEHGCGVSGIDRDAAESGHRVADGGDADRRRLGVLIAADEPADAIDEPAFAVPADETQPVTLLRTDLKLFAGQQQAAERVLHDSSKDWWPTLDAIFQPSTTYPPQFFLPANSWR